MSCYHINSWSVTFQSWLSEWKELWFILWTYLISLISYILFIRILNYKIMGTFLRLKHTYFFKCIWEFSYFNSCHLGSFIQQTEKQLQCKPVLVFLVFFHWNPIGRDFFTQLQLIVAYWHCVNSACDMGLAQWWLRSLQHSLLSWRTLALCSAPSAGGSQLLELLFPQDSVGLFMYTILINSHKNTHICK